MSVPEFDGTDLFSKAGRDEPGSVEARYHAETMPGLDGRFVQPHGRGSRWIRVRGVLQAEGSTPAQAHQNLKAALRARQALVDGQTVAAYVGTDGHSYVNCMLVSYQVAGAVTVAPPGPPYTAGLFVNATVLQLTP